MLRHADATEEIDQRVREAVAQWTRGGTVRAVSYTRDPSAIATLVGLMERFGRRGQIAEAVINGEEAFLYLCARPNGTTFAQGLGSTPGLAVCDAFLGSREDERTAPPPAARATPHEPLLRAAGFKPPLPAEDPSMQCVNCGWEGPTPGSDPRRCPSCHRHFLRPAPRRTH
jgi:hypothetical protein